MGKEPIVRAARSVNAGINPQGEAHAATTTNGKAARDSAAGRPEAELIDAAVHGDSAAFGTLYERHVNRVYRHCYYQAGNRADAEDLTQQTFLQAWKAIRRYRRGEVPFIAWLLTISHRLAISHHRKFREVPGTVELPAGQYDDPETTVMTGVVRDTVRLAILRLKPERQAVILLRYVEGFSVSEVATALGKTDNNVRVIQHRALADLRRLMTETASPQHDETATKGTFREIVSNLMRKVSSRTS